MSNSGQDITLQVVIYTSRAKPKECSTYQNSGFM